MLIIWKNNDFVCRHFYQFDCLTVRYEVNRVDVYIVDGMAADQKRIAQG